MAHALRTSRCGRRANSPSRTARRGPRDSRVEAHTGSSRSRCRSRQSPASSCRVARSSSAGSETISTICPSGWRSARSRSNATVRPLPPPKDPATGPSRIKALPELLIGECLRQENSTQRWIDIPAEIQDLYRQAGRPRPLIRARRLEERLGTPARLYYKTEFYSPTGSHKVNTALAQAWYAQREGYERLTTETGAGQWGTALPYAARLASLPTTIFWVRAVHDWKTQRRQFMRMYGATVHASPSPVTATGRALLEKDPQHPGSLGIAGSEGLEDARRDEKAIYCLGSVLNHVLLHQTVIGLETQRQFEQVGEYPDLMISCLGGGSNFGGVTLPFHADASRGKKIPFLTAHSPAAPNLQSEDR